jgi:drug/metabolite transporter (DMT)-like permease
MTGLFKNEKLYGFVLISLSAFCFGSATIFAKIVNQASDIPGIEITFFRFLLGLIVTSFIVIKRKQSVIPVKKKFVILRAISNAVAVTLFFTGVEYTTVTNANMLNMTYPVFVYLFTPFINKEKNPGIYYLYLAISMGGIFLIINPDFSYINRGDLLSLLSGITAAAAISFLREARKTESSFVILFNLMAIGTVANFFLMAPFYVKPEGILILHIFMSALLGVMGQIFITIGFRYIDAASGALISTSRMLFTAVLGVILFSDPLDFRIAAGGILIFVSLVGVSGFFQRKKLSVS